MNSLIFEYSNVVSGNYYITQIGRWANLITSIISQINKLKLSKFRRFWKETWQVSAKHSPESRPLDILKVLFAQYPTFSFIRMPTGRALFCGVWSLYNFCVTLRKRFYLGVCLSDLEAFCVRGLKIKLHLVHSKSDSECTWWEFCF